MPALISWTVTVSSVIGGGLLIFKKPVLWPPADSFILIGIEQWFQLIL